MKIPRRAFITLLGGATVAWPFATRAQQLTMPVVGYLSAGTTESNKEWLTAFRQGLSESGFVEGRNVVFEYRWGDGHYERGPELVADLVHRQVAVIAIPANERLALIAKAATATIPIVFSMGGDPVTAGLVASYNRPGGNVTGFSSFNMEIGSKRIELLHELVPKATHFGALVNPLVPSATLQITDVRSAVSTIGGQIDVFEARTLQDIEAAFARIDQRPVDALLISPGGPFNSYRVQTVELAARRKMPCIYGSREWAEAGGLISYGPIVADEFRQAGIYAGRILKGEKPADLPILRPTKFELIINLKTATTLGLTVPSNLLATADEVIE